MHASPHRQPTVVGKERTDSRSVRAWQPLRLRLARLGCPDRPPRLLPSGGLYWEGNDLPSRLPATVRGLRESAIGMAVTPGVVILLHAYEAASGTVLVLALCVDGSRRSLTAWRCADQAQAARIAMGQLARWVRLGLGVSVTMAGARTEAAEQGGMPQEAAA